MKRYLGFLGLCFVQVVHAFSWQDLWVTPDQQAQKMMSRGQFAEAESTFMREDWRAAAAYRAGHFDEAAKLYAASRNEEAYYNQGNALARMGQYEKALKAYDAALAINPKHQDAIFNRKVVLDLLKREQQKQEKDQKKQDQRDQDKQHQDQKNKDKQNQDQQSQEQKQTDEENQAKKEGEEKASPRKDKDKPIPEATEADREQQQSKEQWLRLIPDDPGGLMREKFLRDHLRRLHGWDQ
ncbi:MAG: tetratricopeptide repeat protein [Legionellales bacterium]|nr:tetratricopeptide repeat protein [Legionellales bacterium]